MSPEGEPNTGDTSSQSYENKKSPARAELFIILKIRL